MKSKIDLYIYIHQRKHWRLWIEEFGAPVYFSTMHWESKHKQLRMLKDSCTNNTNHERDILLKAMRPHIHHLTIYQGHDNIAVCSNFIYIYFLLKINDNSGYMHSYSL